MPPTHFGWVSSLDCWNFTKELFVELLCFISKFIVRERSNEMILFSCSISNKTTPTRIQVHAKDMWCL